jgi:hypothetical protein
MSPKWFHRVRELFQDGFVGGERGNPGAKLGVAQSVPKSLKKLGKYRA